MHRKLATRLSDASHVEADSHGCKHCAHAAAGPAVSGSSNVLINNRPAVRIKDSGKHASCCGANSWVALTGAPCVLVNGRSIHRVGDLDQHCGGIGRMVGGSPNVLVGDMVGPELTLERSLEITLMDGVGPYAAPLAFTPWRLIGELGVIEEGETDENGKVVVSTRPLRSGRYVLHYPGRFTEIIVRPTEGWSTARRNAARLSAIGYRPEHPAAPNNAAYTAAMNAFKDDLKLEAGCDVTAELQVRAGF